MNKVDFKRDRSEVVRGVQLTDGRIVPVINMNGEFVMKFNTPFNIETGEIYKTKNEFSTDLNEQKRNGAIEVNCYDTHEIAIADTTKLSEEKIKEIIKEFKLHGFDVTRKAILHNYSAWEYDLKSGYRDDKRGYHLFTPCRHNPLSFRATTLHDSCNDWQTTYTWG